MKILMMKKKLITRIIILSVGSAILFIGYKMALNQSFNGVVSKVEYSGKGVPTVTINGVSYYLINVDWGNHNEKIEAGDSMVKVKGATYIRLIKQKKKDTVGFSQW